MALMYKDTNDHVTHTITQKTTGHFGDQREPPKCTRGGCAREGGPGRVAQEGGPGGWPGRVPD
eukprot:7283067-Pyramimonas_sp.AAC.1